MKHVVLLVVLLSVFALPASGMSSADVFTALSGSDLIQEYETGRLWDGYESEAAGRRATESFMETWYRVTPTLDGADVMGGLILRQLGETRFIQNYDREGEWLGHRGRDAWRVSIWAFMRTWGRNVLLMRNLGADVLYPGLAIISIAPVEAPADDLAAPAVPPRVIQPAEAPTVGTISSDRGRTAQPVRASPTGEDLGSISPMRNVDWALAYEESWRSRCKKPLSPKELNARYRVQLGIDEGCTPCRERTYDQWKGALKQHFPNRQKQLVAQVELEQFRDDPLRLAPLLMRLGRADEAERVAYEALSGPLLVEQRLVMLRLLIRIHQRSGETELAESLTRQVAWETPVYPDQCDLGTDFDRERMIHYVDDRRDRIATLTYFHELFRRKPGDPEAACNYWSALASLVKDGSPEERSALFPAGVRAEQRRVARAVSQPRLKAAMLLGAAQSILKGSEGSALPWLEEAAAAGPAPQIQVPVLEATRMALAAAGRDDDAAAVVATLARDYPDYRISFDLCTHPRGFRSADEWASLCWANLQRRTIDNPRAIVHALPKGSIELLEWLLANDPQRVLVPHLLLRLSDEVRATDPERATRLDGEAVRHPEFPGVPGDHARSNREMLAAQREAFESAYIIAVQNRPSIFCGNDRTSMPDYEFRLAFYKVMLGIGTDRHWEQLLAIMPSSLDGQPSRHFHEPRHLDRLARAAQASGHECDALEWLSSVRAEYREAARERGVQESAYRRISAPSPRTTELVLAGTIEELKSSLPRDACGIR